MKKIIVLYCALLISSETLAKHTPHEIVEAKFTKYSEDKMPSYDLKLMAENSSKDWDKENPEIFFDNFFFCLRNLFPDVSLTQLSSQRSNFHNLKDLPLHAPDFHDFMKVVLQYKDQLLSDKALAIRGCEVGSFDVEGKRAYRLRKIVAFLQPLYDAADSPEGRLNLVKNVGENPKYFTENYIWLYFFAPQLQQADFDPACLKKIDSLSKRIKVNLAEMYIWIEASRKGEDLAVVWGRCKKPTSSDVRKFIRAVCDEGLRLLHCKRIPCHGYFTNLFVNTKGYSDLPKLFKQTQSYFDRMCALLPEGEISEDPSLYNLYLELSKLPLSHPKFDAFFNYIMEHKDEFLTDEILANVCGNGKTKASRKISAMMMLMGDLFDPEATDEEQQNILDNFTGPMKFLFEDKGFTVWIKFYKRKLKQKEVDLELVVSPFFVKWYSERLRFSYKNLHHLSTPLYCLIMAYEQLEVSYGTFFLDDDYVKRHIESYEAMRDEIIDRQDEYSDRYRLKKKPVSQDWLPDAEDYLISEQ